MNIRSGRFIDNFDFILLFIWFEKIYFLDKYDKIKFSFYIVEARFFKCIKTIHFEKAYSNFINCQKVPKFELDIILLFKSKNEFFFFVSYLEKKCLKSKVLQCKFFEMWKEFLNLVLEQLPKTLKVKIFFSLTFFLEYQPLVRNQCFQRKCIILDLVMYFDINNLSVDFC